MPDSPLALRGFALALPIARPDIFSIYIDCRALLRQQCITQAIANEVADHLRLTRAEMQAVDLSDSMTHGSRASLRDTTLVLLLDNVDAVWESRAGRYNTAFSLLWSLGNTGNAILCSATESIRDMMAGRPTIGIPEGRMAMNWTKFPIYTLS